MHDRSGAYAATIESESVEISELTKAVVRSRAAELEADPPIGLTWDELDARLASRWGHPYDREVIPNVSHY
jgi:hypothetical protein